MSGCVSFVFMLVIFLVVTSGIPLPFARRDRGRVWRRLAREFNGVFTGIGLISSPVLRFRYGTSRVTCSVSRREAKMTLSWPDTRLECDIVSHDRTKVPTRLPQVQTGDQEFDNHYRLHVADFQQSRSLLSPGLCASLDRLSRQRGNARLSVMFRPGQLTIKKQARFSGYDQTLGFIRGCLELFDQAMLTRAEGIDFCEEDDFRPVEDVRCQVCGDEIYEDLVCCARCHTPHHQECWDYYGSCTVYGCQETEYQHPRTAALLGYTPDNGEGDEGSTERDGGGLEDLELEDLDSDSDVGEGFDATSETSGRLDEGSRYDDADTDDFVLDPADLEKLEALDAANDDREDIDPDEAATDEL